jgi:hypothetical protein
LLKTVATRWQHGCPPYLPQGLYDARPPSKLTPSQPFPAALRFEPLREGRQGLTSNGRGSRQPGRTALAHWKSASSAGPGVGKEFSSGATDGSGNPKKEYGGGSTSSSRNTSASKTGGAGHRGFATWPPRRAGQPRGLGGNSAGHRATRPSSRDARAHRSDGAGGRKPA